MKGAVDLVPVGWVEFQTISLFLTCTTVPHFFIYQTVHRLGAGFASAMDLGPDLVAHSVDEFVEVAVGLSLDNRRRREVVAKMRRNRSRLSGDGAKEVLIEWEAFLKRAAGMGR